MDRFTGNRVPYSAVKAILLHAYSWMKVTASSCFVLYYNIEAKRLVKGLSILELCTNVYLDRKHDEALLIETQGAWMDELQAQANRREMAWWHLEAIVLGLAFWHEEALVQDAVFNAARLEADHNAAILDDLALAIAAINEAEGVELAAIQAEIEKLDAEELEKLKAEIDALDAQTAPAV
jgi:hypothetical protein